ncbi:hypothetical protein P153DRAFT_356163 [Dothidotthia symphoricarpi CBS 119687]|uniref:Uncharacterized protein n=1 Tax=Dothidotthia symphoricarpi CBS 119687 TaxID=1392245 RepID=A0A6A6AFP6_9PLEO|nr:uncharacterized protein P153DRAFT_356163 [Dothidotthia symphoricarpi CBS 119687]KAF2130386.1 hypothetical protein P153DRAFT_356163 [Dothidotthia symphoricarpi CBS 119687]
MVARGTYLRPATQHADVGNSHQRPPPICKAQWRRRSQPLLHSDAPTPPANKLQSLDHGDTKYKYNFKPAPFQHDEIIRHIKLAVRDLNRHNILIANMNFRIVPTNNSPPFWPPSTAFPQYDTKMYTFLDDYNEFPATAWISLVPRMAGLSADALHAKIGSTWMPLKTWLLSMQSPTSRLDGERGFKAQRKWWRLNGQKFRLLDLPAEVRMLVFEHAFGPRLYPLSTVSAHDAFDESARQNAAVKLGLGRYNAKDHANPHTGLSWLTSGCPANTIDYTVPAPNLALLRVSKQVFREALCAGWENTRKTFFSPRHFASVLDAGITPSFNWLNKLILDFSMKEWFEFFGITFRPVFHMEFAECLGYLLLTLPTLVSLQIWFRSPDDGWKYSPWGCFDTLSLYICCQRTMVDWVMTFAWPFVKDLPKVIIGGAVKRDSKRKWDDLLALPMRNKVAVIDQAADEAAIFSTVGPPPCFCRTPCVATHASRYREEWPFYKDEDDFDYENNFIDDLEVEEAVTTVERHGRGGEGVDLAKTFVNLGINSF